MTILTELLGGVAVPLGAFVTIVSVPMMAVLLVAMFKVHLAYGFSSIKLLAVTATGAQFGPVGYEVILLYLACLVALVLGAPGHSPSTDPSAGLDARVNPHVRHARNDETRLDVVDLGRRHKGYGANTPAGFLRLLCGNTVTWSTRDMTWLDSYR